MDRAIIQQLGQSLSESLDNEVKVIDFATCPGGDISKSYKLLTSVCEQQRVFFVKILAMRDAELLTAERRNLETVLTITEKPFMPSIISFGETNTQSFLILEYLEFKHSLTEEDQQKLARQLSKLHDHTNDKHGWNEANFIGTSLQSNFWSGSWSDFWITERLEPQWAMTKNKVRSTKLDSLEQSIFSKTAELLSKHHPTPSLCHGDLWSGNLGVSVDGRPVFYDPASYYGDPETDVAMTKLFGGFSPSFYKAYEAVRPLPEGADKRVKLYQLYHALNHLNLFGQGYLDMTLGICDDILKT